MPTNGRPTCPPLPVNFQNLSATHLAVSSRAATCRRPCTHRRQAKQRYRTPKRALLLRPRASSTWRSAETSTRPARKNVKLNKSDKLRTADTPANERRIWRRASSRLPLSRSTAPTAAVDCTRAVLSQLANRSQLPKTKVRSLPELLSGGSSAGQPGQTAWWHTRIENPQYSPAILDRDAPWTGMPKSSSLLEASERY